MALAEIINDVNTNFHLGDIPQGFEDTVYGLHKDPDEVMSILDAIENHRLVNRPVLAILELGGFALKSSRETSFGLEYDRKDIVIYGGDGALHDRFPLEVSSIYRPINGQEFDLIYDFYGSRVSMVHNRDHRQGEHALPLGVDYDRIWRPLLSRVSSH